MATAVNYIIKFGEKIGIIKEGVSAAAEAARELVILEDNLEQKERDYTVNSAKRSLEVARLRNEATDKIKNDAKTREKMLEEAIILEQQNLEDEKEIAAEHLRIITEKAKQDVDTSDETANKIAEAQARLFRAEEQYYSGTRRLQSQLLTARKENAAEEEARAKEMAELRKSQLNSIATLTKQLEDSVIEAMEDGYKKQREIAILEANREIDALEKSKTAKENKTREAQDLINAIIFMKREELNLELSKIDEKNAREELDKQFQIETERINALLASEKKGSEEYYQLRLMALNRLKDAEIAATEEGSLERLQVVRKFAEQELQIKQEIDAQNLERQKLALANDFEARRQALENDEVALSQLKIEQALAERQALDQIVFDSEEARTAAILAANDKVTQSSKALENAQLKAVENQANAYIAMGGAISQVFGAIAGDSEAFAQFQKMIALAEAAINLGVAISAATATATPGDPYTVAARIASAVAGVIAAFVSVTKSINSAKVPKAPKFASGGVVSGTSLTGDSIMAYVNSGERILTANQNKIFENLANVFANGGSRQELIDYERMAIAIAENTNVYLDFNEFDNARNKVVKYNEYATL